MIRAIKIIRAAFLFALSAIAIFGFVATFFYMWDHADHARELLFIVSAVGWTTIGFGIAYAIAKTKI